MIRIAHVISDLDAGGAESMLVKLVGGIDRHRFFSAVISLTDGGQLGEEMKALGVPVYTLGMKRGRPDIFAIPRLIKLLRHLKPAIIQSWLYHADLLSTLAVKFSGCSRLIWNVRCSEMDLSKYPPLTRFVQRLLIWCSRVPAAIVVNSEAGKLQHQRLGYHPRRWHVIPNGFDTRRFRPNTRERVSSRKELGAADHEVIVALIARLDPMKDHNTFLEAAQQIARTRKNVYFALIGKDTEQLANRIAVKGLKERAWLLGYRHDIAALLPAVDIVCLSSIGEGFPNVLGEAMACAIPCVSTDVGDARNIIGDTGIVVPVRDPKALAEAIIDLIDLGPGRRTALGIAARERIEKKYSLQKIVEQYTALYSQLASTSSC